MNRVKTLLAATLALAMAFTFSCSSGDDGNGGSPPVASNCSLNGGKVTIGTQVWMKENLNCNVSGSKCYNDDPANCDKYGRLYDWATAMALSNCGWNGAPCAPKISAKHRGICPQGWHIPSNAEWDALYRYVDGTSGTDSPYDSPTAGRYLKATSGWNSNGNGLDDFGFSALPGGIGYSVGLFRGVGDGGCWFSSSSDDSDLAYFREMSYDRERASGGHYGETVYCDRCKNYLFSVRCLQD